jgi:sugar/nucleoside kinase (ribokinase family)
VQNRDSVLVVGSIAFDDLEMPQGTFEGVLGGAGTYSSLAASILAPVRIVGVVGEDFPPAHLELLRSRGIDTTGVERVAGKTFRWRGRYSADLCTRTTLDTQLNVFADFHPKIPAAHCQTPYVLLGNIHPQLQLEVVAQIQKARLVAADTMNLWISTEPAALEQLLKKVDLLIINDEEARQMAGVQNLVKAAREIRKRGPSQLIVKRGEHGALLFDNHGIFFVPAYPLEEVHDPTGAGDCFAGGLIGYLARVGAQPSSSPNLMRRAMFHAAAMGSFCVEEVGPKAVERLTEADLMKRLEAFRGLVDFGGTLAAE